MLVSRGQVGVVICLPLKQRRNRQSLKRTDTVNRVVFVLRNAGVVKSKIRKVRRCMTPNAVPNSAICDFRGSRIVTGRFRQKNSKALQLLRAESERLRVKFKTAGYCGRVGIDELELARTVQFVNQSKQPPTVLLRVLVPRGLARKTVYGEKYVER